MEIVIIGADTPLGENLTRLIKSSILPAHSLTIIKQGDLSFDEKTYDIVFKCTDNDELVVNTTAYGLLFTKEQTDKIVNIALEDTG